MRIESVNVGQTRTLSGRGFEGETGICKAPATGPVAVSPLGLAGDSVVHVDVHGGQDQAVYLYRQEDYDWWGHELGRTLAPGTFGENLTISGLPTADLAIGCRLRMDDLLLEITAPRIPCNILAARLGDPAFLKAFIRAERPGAYCRVLESGTVCAGQSVTLDPSHASDVTLIEVFRAAYRKPSREDLERFLSAPIDARTRADYEKKLSAAV